MEMLLLILFVCLSGWFWMFVCVFVCLYWSVQFGSGGYRFKAHGWWRNIARILWEFYVYDVEIDREAYQLEGQASSGGCKWPYKDDLFNYQWFDVWFWLWHHDGRVQQTQGRDRESLWEVESLRRMSTRTYRPTWRDDQRFQICEDTLRCRWHFKFKLFFSKKNTNGLLTIYHHDV